MYNAEAGQTQWLHLYAPSGCSQGLEQLIGRRETGTADNAGYSIPDHLARPAPARPDRPVRCGLTFADPEVHLDNEEQPLWSSSDSLRSERRQVLLLREGPMVSYSNIISVTMIIINRS